MSWLLVALGAAVGAPLRYLTDRWVASHHNSVFPWGTFTVNIAGSAILGAIMGLFAAGLLSSPLRLLVAMGFCGALTTYSTFSYETVRLAEDGARLIAVANVTGTLFAGVLAFAGASAAVALIW